MNTKWLATALAAMALSAGQATAAEPAPPSPAAAADRDTLVGPAIHVSNLARSIHFYKDVLGMTVAMQFGADGKPLNVRERTAKGHLGEGFANTVLTFGGGPADPLLMLLPDSSATPRPIAHGNGYARTAFRMADLPAINARLKAAGFTPGEIKGAHGVFQVMMIQDPDGYTVEIIERSPRK